MLYALSASNVIDPTRIDGFSFYTVSSGTTGASVITVLLSDCSDALQFSNNSVLADDAEDGSDGDLGTDGTNGSDGEVGMDGGQFNCSQDSYDGGAGGTNTCTQSGPIDGGDGASNSMNEGSDIEMMANFLRSANGNRISSGK